MKKFFSAILAVVTAISFAGCEFKSPATVLTINGETVSSGIYLIYQYLSFSNAINRIADIDTPLAEQTINDIPAEEWIHTETLNEIKTHLYVAKAFDEMGFSFTADELTGFKTQASETYAQNEKLFAKNGIGNESYFALFLNSRMEAKLLEDYKEKNPISDDEIRKYTDDTYANIAVVSFPLTDKDTAALTDDMKKEIDKIAAELEAEINGGKELNKTLAEATVKKALEAVGREFTTTSVDSYFSTSYISEESAGSFSEEEHALMLAASVGSAKISKTDSKMFLWGRIKSFPSQANFDELKTAVSGEIQEKAHTAAMKAITDTYTLEEDSKAVSYYSVSKAKIM